jgi:zinc and cadmium transporter
MPISGDVGPGIGLVLGLGLVGSVGALVPACAVLFVPETWRHRWTPHLLSYATGTMLGAAIVGLIPEALERMSAERVSVSLLAGLVMFFMLEWFILRMTAPADAGDGEASQPRRMKKTAGALILIGDTVHNFADGIAIGAACLVSPSLGVATTVAVVGHEVPQEIGDFAILLASGFSRGEAFVWNGLSGLATVVGALIAYGAVAQVSFVVPYVLSVAAASFLYIGLADLVPGLQGRLGAGSGPIEFLLMIAGIVTIGLLPH